MIDYNIRPGKSIDRIEFKDYKPIVSIITPFYKGHEYIMETANCVLSQTFPYFEWIIVNDGSPVENTEEFLSKIEKLDSRIHVYHKRNGGLASTRDFGATKVSKESKYFVFLDDDDVISNTYIETLYYSLETYEDASWAYTDVLNFGKKELSWKKQFDSKVMEDENLLVATAMIRRKDFEEIGGYHYRDKAINEDWLFWLRLIEKGKYPIHQSYDGFWYRIKENGELSLSLQNQKVTNEYKQKICKRIKNKVYPIEFPRENYNWDKIVEKSIVYPKYISNKKNILYIIPWMVVGGADKFNLDFLASLDKKEYHVTVVTTQPTPSVWKQKFELVSDEIFELSTFLDCKFWPFFIKYLMNSRNIDLIINTNSTTGYMLLPYIKGSFPNVPIIDYIHMEEWYNRNGGYSRDSAPFSSIIDKTLFCNANSAKIMVDYFGKKEDEVGTVYIGVDEKKFDPSKYDRLKLRKKYGIPNDKTIVGFMARIDYQKRPMLLMQIIKEAVKNDKKLFFVIAGDGPLLEKIKGFASANKLNKYVMFLGNLEKSVELYSVSDMTLNCSIKEGLALTSYESLSMGIPVISSDVGGQKELISADVGVIVPCLQKEEDVFDFNYSTEEIKQYVDAIEKISKKLKVYKSKCRDRIVKGFTISKMTKDMKRIVDNVIDNPSEGKINNGKALSKMLNMQLELYTQYLLENKGLYKWLCDEYCNKVYGFVTNNLEKSDNVVSVEKRDKVRHLNFKLSQFACKIHLINEYNLFRDFAWFVYQIIINIYRATILTLYRFLLLLFTRIRNLLFRIVGIER